MGIINRDKKASDKTPKDIQKFLKEAFSLYAWCIKNEDGPNGVGEIFGEYFGSDEGERESLRGCMQQTHVSVQNRSDSLKPLLETIQWCIHEGDKIIWKKIEAQKEGDDEIWTFNVTYRHKPMNAGPLDRNPVIGTEYDFEEVWKVKNRDGGRYAVVAIKDGEDIQMFGKGITSGDFEMPGKEIGKIIKKEKWAKKRQLPHPF